MFENPTNASLAGQLGSGKSFLLLQAVEYCHKKGYVVLYIPRCMFRIHCQTIDLKLIRVFSYEAH
jgi:hypothetical protein